MAELEEDSAGDEDALVFTAGVLLDVARRIMEASDAILIGGQSLNIWAETYKSEVEELGSLAPFQSKDIDYLATVKDVQACEVALNSKARFPSFEDATPEVGVIDVNIHNKPLQIDFLGSVSGLKNSDIRKAALIVKYEGTQIRVLHPINVLQSRLSNVCGPLARTDTLSLRQMRAAVYVVKAFIQATAEKDEKLARDLMEAVFEIARSNHALKLWHMFGIDIGEVIQEYPNLNKTLVERRLTNMKRDLEKKRTKYKKVRETEVARKLAKR